MAQLQRAIWLADRPSQEVWIARCSARIATDSSSTRPSSQEVPIQINRVTPAIALQQRFDALVMCNFTPRSPSELPPPQWVSCNRPHHSNFWDERSADAPITRFCLLLCQTSGCSTCSSRTPRQRCGRWDPTTSGSVSSNGTRCTQPSLASRPALGASASRPSTRRTAAATCTSSASSTHQSEAAGARSPTFTSSASRKARRHFPDL